MGRMEDAGLYVQMLGGFSVSYKGKEVILGRKSTLKYIQMLQLIWLQGQKGIRKDKLIEALYGWSDVQDANNSVNNLVHQIRKHMKAAGLPKSEYIILKEGIYQTDPVFPVRTDIEEFEDLTESGFRAQNRKERERCFRGAFDLYQGEILPAISTEIWVIERQLELKKVFIDCVEQLGICYQESRSYQELEQIYEKTARIYPCDSWEIGQIDALLEQGENKKALEIYQRMTREYMERMGLPPTPEMMACYDRINKKSRDIPGNIEEVRHDLEEYVEHPIAGAYFCSYQSFVDLCHVVRRSMERQGRSVFLMLCTLVDYEGKTIRNKEKLQERSKVLEEVIYSCLRESDAFTQYNPSQYLILLTGINQENCEIVYRRIKAGLQERLGSRAAVLYEVSSLAEFLKKK